MQHIDKYLESLYKLERVSIKYDLSNIKKLLSRIGNPHLKTKFIHIAGTNGKGATASFIASILIEYGFKTGLYTSPHLLRFNERIQINSKFIPDEYIKSFMDDNLDYIKRIRASFFEATTAMAFMYFADSEIDIAVIETGLGGRLDSTNVINAKLCIITQIGIDHTQYLGKTLKSIALEKIGIAKSAESVIVGDNHISLRRLFESELAGKSVYFISDKFETRTLLVKPNKTKFLANIILAEQDNLEADFTIPMDGTYQISNACTAVLAAFVFLKSLGRYLSVPNFSNGLVNVKKNTFYHGRFEFIKLGLHDFILDVAHNPDAIGIDSEPAGSKNISVIVFGIMEDKDFKSSIRKLSRLRVPIIFTKPEYSRARDPLDLFFFYSSICRKPSIAFIRDNLAQALNLAKQLSSSRGKILIIGSFFLVSETIRILKIENKLS